MKSRMVSWDRQSGNTAPRAFSPGLSGMPPPRAFPVAMGRGWEEGSGEPDPWEDAVLWTRCGCSSSHHSAALDVCFLVFLLPRHCPVGPHPNLQGLVLSQPCPHFASGAQQCRSCGARAEPLGSLPTLRLGTESPGSSFPCILGPRHQEPPLCHAVLAEFLGSLLLRSG